MNSDSVTDDERFAVAIGTLAVTFNQPMGDERIKAWRMALHDLPINDIATAVVRAQRECTWMPSVAELRALAGDPTPEQRAAIVWAQINHGLNSSDSYDCDDPITLACIRAMGGVTEFTYRCREENHWAFKSFSSLYVLYSQTGINEHQSQRLIGSDERTFRAGKTTRPFVTRKIVTGLQPKMRVANRPLPRIEVEKTQLPETLRASWTNELNRTTNRASIAEAES